MKRPCVIGTYMFSCSATREADFKRLLPRVPVNEREETMTCPFLQDEQHVTCKACGTMYIPSSSETRRILQA